jgi:glycosyltransferase involved in cell wall biosynthesis
VRLAIDIKSLSLHQSGIAAYTLGLLRLLAARPLRLGDAGRLDGESGLAGLGEVEIVLAGPQAALDAIDARWPFERCPVELPAALGPLRIPYYDQVALPRAVARLSATALFTPNWDAPIVAGCPRIVTIHDLAYVRFAAAYPRAVRAYYGRLARWHARHAAAILTDSAFSAREIAALIPGAAAPVEVMPAPVAPEFLDPIDPARVRAFAAARRLPDRFVLYTGGADARKNVPLLAAAMRTLNEQAAAPVPLVITGAGRAEAAWRAQLGDSWQEACGMFLGSVAPAEMPLLYSAASVVAYVSRYEGFGLPVLEALAAGAPVVSTRVGFLADDAAPGVSLVTEDTPSHVASLLRAALNGRADGGSGDGSAAGDAARQYARRTQETVLPAFARALAHAARRTSART